MKVNVYEHWCHLECGNCKYFQVDADRREDTTCKRLDHKTFKLAVPYFKSYDCGQYHCNICSEFEPADYCKWLKEHWKSIDAYIAEYEQAEHKSFFKNRYVSLTIGDDTLVRYYVKRKDYFDGNFINPDGSLKWVKRCFYRRSKSSPIGYKLVWEYNEEV